MNSSTSVPQIPARRTSTTTCPAPGTGSSTSSTRRPGPPITSARMPPVSTQRRAVAHHGVPQLAGDQRLLGRRGDDAAGPGQHAQRVRRQVGVYRGALSQVRVLAVVLD